MLSSKTSDLSSCLSWMIWEMIWERDLAVLLCETSLDKYLVSFWYFISLRCKQIHVCKRHEWILAHTNLKEREWQTFAFQLSLIQRQNRKNNIISRTMFLQSNWFYENKTSFCIDIASNANKNKYEISFISY